MTDVSEIADRGIEALKIDEATARELKRINALLNQHYRDRFLEMASTMRIQAAQLERIQTTLAILVEHVAPSLRTSVPVAFAASGDAEPDIATTFVVADPIGAGFTLSQAQVGQALNLTSSVTSVVVRALGLSTDPNHAVTVRSRPDRDIVNYHRSAVARLRELIENAPLEPTGKLARGITKAMYTSAVKAAKRSIEGAG